MKGGKQIVVGWRYSLGAHLVPCQGADEVQAIKIGEKAIWEGNITANQTISIDEEDLFGGDERQGGVIGDIDLEFGLGTQGQNAYLQGVQDTSIPSYRGVFGLVFKQVYMTANNPFMKPVSLLAKRIPAATWYAAKADINGDANPAHIIYECLTSVEWGLGYSAGDIDDAAFKAVADKLFTENFGISLVLDAQTSVEDFLLIVQQHIDGTVFLDQATGLFTLTLVRDDFDPNTLPVFDTSNIVDLDTYARSGISDLVNQVTLIYQDRDTHKNVSVTIQDLAVMSMQNGVVATTIEYKGISNGTLANTVAARELRTLAQPLARVKLVANREAFALKPGGVFKFTWPNLGITEMILRIVSMNFGELLDGKISINAVEDVFFNFPSIFADPPPTLWTPPIQTPIAATTIVPMVVPFWFAATKYLDDNQAIWDGVSDTAAFLMTIVERPIGGSTTYDMLINVVASDTGHTVAESPVPYTPFFSLAVDLDLTTTVIAVTLVDVTAIQLIGKIAVIGNELLFIQSISAGNMTVRRGILDTIPAEHVIGDRIWFFEDAAGVSTFEFTSNVTAYTKVLPNVINGQLPIASAVWDSLATNERFAAPYVPGRPAIQGVLRGTVVSGVNTTLNINWANRDRTDTSALVAHDLATAFGPEVGADVKIEVYDLKVGGVLLTTFTGAANQVQEYTALQAFTDNGNVNLTEARVEIYSVRDGIRSIETLKLPIDWEVTNPV